MKSFKHVALGAFLVAGTFGVTLYSSCSKDKCKDIVCKNGGSCNEGVCSCPTGWLGANCETKAFIGTWTGTDVCSPTGTYNINIILSNATTDSTKVLINNPGGFGTNNTISGTLSADGKTITYTNQIVNSSSSPDTLTGTLTLTDNTHFTHAYTAKEGLVYSCNGNYTKQ